MTPAPAPGSAPGTPGSKTVKNKSCVQASDAPAVFWCSDPVAANQTLVIAGDGFGLDAVVELAGCDDAPAGDPPTVPAASCVDVPRDWQVVTPAQITTQSIKAVVPPGGKPTLWRCRVRRGDVCGEAKFVNAADVWWTQGDEGSQRATAGGWLRLHGKCLDFGQPVRVALRPVAGGAAVDLPIRQTSGYRVVADLPADLATGDYDIHFHHGLGGPRGWTSAGRIQVIAPVASFGPQLNVVDFGADPTGKKDCTLAVVQGLERLSGLGGGVLFFPAGRYRIDSILRPGMWIQSPLRVPRHVVMRGEGMHVTSLWWPDQKEPLPTLIEAQGDLVIEDLAIYTQGRHRNVISSDGENVRIRRVRIRANCYYMCMDAGRSHHRRGVEERALEMGAAVELWGANHQVTDCDIYHSARAFSLMHMRGGVIARNKVRAMGFAHVHGPDRLVIEDNDFEANSLTGMGNGVDLFFGASYSRHVYWAGNRIAHLHGGDHEALTLDGHGTAYFGHVAESHDTRLLLADDPILGRGQRDSIVDLNDTCVYIHHGRGRGQYRWIRSAEGRRLTLDRPWGVEPDDSSVISVGVFNGRHLIIGNTLEETGTAAQLYPPNIECIVAENRIVHASNINSVSKLGRNTRSRFARVEPSWYNQFLDNHIEFGNGWGGGETEIDRWIGGETQLNIWGWQVAFDVDEHGCDQDRPLTEADLAAMLQGRCVSPPVCIPLSLFQIVRGHRVDHQSSIRVRGAVSDVLIEGCVIKNHPLGIRVDNEVVKEHVADVGQLVFEPPQKATEPGEPQPMLSPRAVLLRDNHFENVATPYSGTALCGVMRM